MSTDISEGEWLMALTSILEELDGSEYKKMLFLCCFDKIPKRVKTGTSKEVMPQTIIEKLGVDESISAIQEAMEELPRRDPKVQDLLRPFVDKLRNKHQAENKDQPKSSQPDKKFEQKWKTSLNSILEELDDSEYRKMLLILDKIPKGQKTDGSREEMPQIIIKYYGAEESVFAIEKVMDYIPRRDPAVQDKLRPFVEQLKKERQTKIKDEEDNGRPSEPDSSGTAGSSAGATGGNTKTEDKHFVDKHKLELINRVHYIDGILDELLEEKVIEQEVCERIRVQRPTQDQVRALYDGPLKAGGKLAKDVFYKILEEKEKYLIADLKK